MFSSEYNYFKVHLPQIQHLKLRALHYWIRYSKGVVSFWLMGYQVSFIYNLKLVDHFSINNLKEKHQCE